MSKVLITDVSFYEDDPKTPRHIDFNKMKFAGVSGTIIRVGQKDWVDPSFVQSWKDAKLAGLPRGSYWFLDSRADMKVQAQLYVEQHKGDFGELPLSLDFEELDGVPDVTALMLKDALEEVHRLVPNKEIMIYTGYWYWKDHVPASLYDYFKQYSLWIAAYNSVGPTIPAPFTDYLLWQFSEEGEGSTYGTEGRVDLNYFNGDEAAFKARFNLNPVVHVKSRKYDSDIHTVVVPKGTPMNVYASGYRNTVPSMASKSGAKTAVNGGDYDPYSGKPVGIVAVNGLVKSGFEGYMPWLNITKENEVHINEWNNGEPPWNAIAGRRFLVVDGKVSPNTSSAWLEVHPKTFFGVTVNGSLIVITADGRTPQSRGVNLYEGAQLLIDAGAVLGFDGGGGGDTTLVVDGKVANVPIADTTPGELRLVADGVMIFGTTSALSEEEEDPMATDMKYQVIKSARFRSAPTMSTNDTGASSIPEDMFFVLAVQQDTNNPLITMVQHPNGKWLPVSITGTEFTRWINKPTDPTDPADPTPAEMDLQITVRNVNVVDVYVNDVKYKKE